MLELKIESLSHKLSKSHNHESPGRESGVSEPEGMKYYAFD